MRRPDGSVHVRIGGVSVDEVALCGLREADFSAQLSEAIAGQFRGEAAVKPHTLADRIADAISARLATTAEPPKVGGRRG